MSFFQLCSPYYLSGTVKNSDALVMMSPEKFKKQYDIEARTDSEVLSVDRRRNHPGKKRCTGMSMRSGMIFWSSPGASPIRPKSIEGVDRPNVFTKECDGYCESEEICHRLPDPDVAVVGGDSSALKWPRI